MSTKHTPDVDWLADSAIGLDLKVAYDRAVFRMRVAERTKATTVEAIREMACSSAPGRYSATRALAEAYIAKTTGSDA